jgi:tetratricopeptide (TPR) repeat protein
MLVRYLAVGAAILFGSSAATAQTVAEHIAAGDSAHAQLKAEEALANYKEAIALDSNSYEALWKGARDAVDLGEFEPNKEKRTALFGEAEHFSKRAVEVNPNDAEGHFHMARALGRVALSLGKKDRVKYAKVIRDQALEALKIDSLHPGALHVMGMWNAEVMRLSGLSRFFATNFLGGDIFSQASWKEAVRYMEKAVEVDPKRIVHHLDLAKVYLDDKQKDKAREQLQMVIDGPITDFNDQHYKDDARTQLDKLGK